MEGKYAVEDIKPPPRVPPPLTPKKFGLLETHVFLCEAAQELLRAKARLHRLVTVNVRCVEKRDPGPDQGVVRSLLEKGRCQRRGGAVWDACFKRV